jgi:hypothetical protein
MPEQATGFDMLDMLKHIHDVTHPRPQGWDQRPRRADPGWRHA